MSLISDAIKTAQRERNSRAQAGKDPQPLIEGFFPYVSSAPAQQRSRRTPIIVISSAVVVLLGVVGFLMWPALAGERKPQATSPIVLPPRATVTQKPLPIDTAAIAVTETRGAANDAAVSPDRAARTVPPAPRQSIASGDRPAIRVADPEPARRDPAPARPSEVIERAPVAATQPAVTRVDYEAQATAAFNAGDLITARERFLLATRLAPTARAWTNYGVTLQRLGDLGGASAAYQSAIGIDANYLEAWLYQGRLAVQLGDITKAVPLFQRARSINPRHTEVNVELARLEAEAKNWTEARRFAAEAVRGDATNAHAQWYLAVSSDQLKDVDVATRAYTAYLQVVGAAEREQAQFVGYARERLAALRGRP